MARSKKPQGTDAKSHPVAPLAATTDDDPRIDATVLLSDALETDATLAPPSQLSHPIVTTRAGPSFETDATLAPPHKLPTSVALPPNDCSLETGLTLALRSDAPSPGSAIETDATLAPPSKEVLETGATVASTGLPPPTHADAGTLPVGAKIGRLMILRTLGAGGMGVVYAAYDPELDRNVALKLIRAGKASQMAQLRLYREAQALAKLNHPNVVSVHDVGKHAGQVWLAMEFVDGVTLGDWVEREKPGWHDVLEVLKQAALGVSAAHAAGLLHRDLKPDNIMIGNDLRVRVMDFGLARTGAETDDTTERAPASAIKRDELSLELTAAGAVMGTPAYMAVEQFLGIPADERTDVFALCATLWEALYGQRAYRGETFYKLGRAVAQGEVYPPPAKTRVPGWLRAAVEKGLAPKSEHRHPSVDALLAALNADPTHRRRWIVGAIAVVLGIIGYFGVTYAAREQVLASCEQEGAAIEAIWNPEARDAVRAGLLATGVPYAKRAAEQVTHYLDNHSQAWKQASEKSCLDAHVHKTWDEATLERARWCLDARRMEMAAVVRTLSAPDTTATQRAVSIASGLSRIQPCREPHRLHATPPLPREREGVDAVREQLAQARTTYGLGNLKEGLKQAQQALEAAEALAWPPLRAEARSVMGSVLWENSKTTEAREALEQAYFEASDVGAYDIAATTAIKLVFTVGNSLPGYAEGLRWARHADIALTHLNEPEASPRRATLLVSRARLRRKMGTYEEAVTLGSRSLAMHEQLFGPTHPKVANALYNLANAQRRAGRPEQALELTARALEIRERSFGTKHPSVAIVLRTQASSLGALGKHEQAILLKKRAVTIIERTFGAEHRRTAKALDSLANSHVRLGDLDRGEALAQRVLKIRQATLKPGHTDIASSFLNLASLARRRGDLTHAKTLLEQARTILESARGPDHPDVARVLDSLAAVYREQQAWAESDRLLQRVSAIYEQTSGPDHPAIAEALLMLANNALDRNEPATAHPYAERALEIYTKAGKKPKALAPIQFALARALRGRGSEQPRARELATQARDAYRDVGDKDNLARVEQFLEPISD